MSVTTIKYEVSPTGITPSTVQFGGTQGDNKATEIQVELNSSIAENVKRKVADVITSGGEGKAVYRFDGYDGEGNVVHGNPKELTDGIMLTYPLEEWLTRYGGVITVYLVITVIVDDITEMELYSFPMKLRLNNTPDAPYSQSRESISVLAENIKANAKVAEDAANAAMAALEKLNLMRAELEGGAEWVFDGGLPNEEIDIRFLIDTVFNRESNNAVSGKAIGEALDNLRKEIFLEAHPVGSYFWSSKLTSPEKLFGGTWEQITGRFVLAAGTGIDENDTKLTFSSEETGGNYTHRLTEAEMPSHEHDLGPVKEGDAKFLVPSSRGSGGGHIPPDYAAGNIPYSEYFTKSVKAKATGGEEYHNNMPPYIVAYCWRRTA